MRAPGFWSDPPGAPSLLARVLWPASLLWRRGTWLRRRWARPVSPGVPVICVGNLTAGGAGKTPTVMALVERLQAAGHTPHVLSRGHGGRRRGPHRVVPETDTAEDVGDEPLLLAALAPTWIARDRAAGAQAAVAAGTDVIVMDDGLQNPHLAKNLSLAVIDAEAGLGNGRVIPAGPLREPAMEGLARADLVLLIGTAEARARALERWPVIGSRPSVSGEIRPGPSGLALSGIPVVAFAGIGRPDKMFATLASLGAEVIEAVPFPDHHVYHPAQLRRLLRTARGQGAMLVTTEKDAVRLPPEMRREVITLPVRLEIADWAQIDAALRPLGLLPQSADDGPKRG